MENSVYHVNPFRRIISTAIGASVATLGFRSVTRSASETLTEMVVSFLSEIGRSGKVACELAGRTAPVTNDIIFSLIEVGFPVRDLIKFHKDLTDPASGRRKVAVVTPSTAPVPNPPSLLHVDGPTVPGKKKRMRHNIPDSFPDFPDAHTYIWTPTYKQPVTDYITIRDKAASQKRDVEKALCRFIAKTGITQNIFLEVQDTSLPLPVISVEGCPQPYMRALLFKDQYFNEETDEGIEYAGSRRRKRRLPTELLTIDTSVLSDSGDMDGDLDDVASPSPNSINLTPVGSKDCSETTPEKEIDNPYLKIAKRVA